MKPAGYFMKPADMNVGMRLPGALADTTEGPLDTDCNRGSRDKVHVNSSDHAQVNMQQHEVERCSLSSTTKEPFACEPDEKLRNYVSAYVSAHEQSLNSLVKQCFAAGVQAALASDGKSRSNSASKRSCAMPCPPLSAVKAVKTEDTSREESLHEKASFSPKASARSGARERLASGQKAEVQDESNALRKQDTSRSSMVPSNSSGRAKSFIMEGVTQGIQKWINEKKGLFAEFRTKELSATKLEHLRNLEICTAVMVLIDTIWTGWQVQYYSSIGKTHPAASVGNVLISIAYVIEISGRLWIRGYGFFQPPNLYWNVFDCVIVASSVVEEAIGLFSQDRTSVLMNLSLLRTLRMLRCWRVIRYVRTFESGRELRMLTNSALRACRSLVWAASLFVVLLYIFAVALTSGASELCGADQSETPLCAYFGLIGDSMVTLYKVMSDGMLWNEVAAALTEVSSTYMFIFCLYVTLAKFVAVNMVLAVIVAVVRQTNRRDLEDIINDELEDRRMYYGFLHDLFHQMDINMNGSLSRQEMELALQHDNRVLASFEALKIDTTDLCGLFRLLVGDENGAIGVDEFILGCLWLRGQARTVDIMKLHLRTESISAKIHHLSSHLLEEEDSEGADINQETSIPRKGSIISDGHEQSAKVLNVRSGARVTRIKRVEERAMQLSELLDLKDLIWKGCSLESWIDLRSGEELTPEDVNLYHFSYNMLCPSTVEAVILGRVSTSNLQKGSVVKQVKSNGHPVAEGVVDEIMDTGVKVSLQKGRFVNGLPLYAVGALGLDDGGQCNGVVQEVKSIGACSYKELIAGNALLPTWFCSHFWGESILDFVKCCERHSMLRHLHSNVGYWICAYANCQHELHDEIGHDPGNSSFRKAMRAATGVLLILDNLASPFSRIWCDFELYCTITDGKPLDTITVHEDSAQLLSDQTMLLPHESMLAKTEREEDFPISLITKALCVNLEAGSASNEQDRKQILHVIANEAGGDFASNLERANSRLRGVFARAVWPQALRRGCVEAFGPDALSLSDVLSRDRFRQRLCMSLAHFSEVTDDEIRNLAAGVPSEISHLILSFQGCIGVTNRGLHILARGVRLLEKLRTLSLDFLGCEHISDAGIEALADCVPSSLQDLRLHFDACPQVGPKSAHQLAAGLPPGLSTVHVSFLGTRVNRVFKSKGELLSYSRANR